jgi:hypothetical protein
MIIDMMRCGKSLLIYWEIFPWFFRFLYADLLVEKNLASISGSDVWKSYNIKSFLIGVILLAIIRIRFSLFELINFYCNFWQPSNIRNWTNFLELDLVR